MRLFNKFVESKKEPYNKNDIWFDGSSWKMYKEGVWRSFTLPIELAKDIEDAVKDLDLDNYLKKTDIDSALSETSTNPVENKVITERLNNIKTDTPDWNASEGKAGHIKGRSHYIDGAISIPFEHWDKRFDEDGNAIYFHTLPHDNYSGCLIREGGWQEENYVFFGTEWKALYPAVSADIRINYDSDSGDSVLEIILYRDADSESFFATFINNALFAYGNGEDFIHPIAKEFIPDTIARQDSVDELREETTALWENLDSGTFPNLTAGDLAGRGESVPASFGFRASGGKSIKDGRAYIKRIKGNSVVWNNMAKTFQAQDCELSENGNLLTITPQGGFPGATTAAPMPFVIGHKYICVSYRLGGGRLMINCDGYDGDTNVVFTAQKGQNGAVIYDYDETEQFTITRPIIVDLTKMFQAGNEPTTIEEFNARVATLGVDMNAYNEGQVIHCNTESIKSVGDNAWDEQWENGSYNLNTGEKMSSNGYICSSNLSMCLPNEKYYIKTPKALYILWYDNSKNYISNIWASNSIIQAPSNATYFAFRSVNIGDLTTYNHDIMITLVHSGWKQDTDAKYQPYWQDILPLPIILKYFPDGMKKAGSAHDEIRFNKASGKWEYSKGKIKSVDLGTFDYTTGSTNLADSKRMRALTKISDAIIPSSDAQVANILCRRYIAVSSNNNWQNSEGVCISADGYLYVYDKEKQDAAAFKADMQGVILYYESNDWEWVELDAEDQNFRDYYQVADFGTEQAILATDAEGNIIPSAAFSADIIYQFNAVDMIREHEMEINELQDTIKAMQAQLTSLINK